MSKSKNPRLVFFDMEGTIFKKAIKDRGDRTAPSVWSLIAQRLGAQALAEEDATRHKWNTEQYSGYVEWMKETIEIHKKYGLSHETFNEVLSGIEYHPGVHETFTALRSKGIITGLISGGFKAQADRAQRELFIDHAFSACEYFWDDDGKLLWWNLLPCDYEGKVDFMKLIMQEHGLKPEECAFVGDGRNDVHLAQAVGTSICFNGAKELAKASTHVISQEPGKEDFGEMCKLLLSF